MSKNTYSEIIVVDLEATCWDTPEEQAKFTSEIIEVGVCVLNIFTGEITKPEGLIVKPRQSKISPFCEKLTSITQEMVDEGMKFEKAMKILKMEYGSSSRALAGYGNYDQNMLNRQCINYAITPPFGPTYINISALASFKLKTNGRLGLEDALAGFNLKFEGRPHRGVDDALQAARVLWEIIK